MHRSLGAVLARFILAFAGAAAAQSSAETASVADSAQGGGRSGGTFFYLAAVDGKPTADNNLNASLQASRGRGPNLLLKPFERTVSSGRVRLKLVASIAYSAPIQSLFSSGDPKPLEGEVEIELAPGGHYRVAGALDAFRREVWLEDDTGKLMGTKIAGTIDDPAVAKQMAGAQFTCCNLHYEGDWISDANWVDLPFVPAGSRIVLKDYGRNKAEVLVEGRPMRLGLDYGRQQETREQFSAKLMVKEDPRLRLATYPAEVQDAIRAGKVMIGMSKEQVIMSLGYPRLDKTASLAAAQWIFHNLEEEEFAVVWGTDEQVKRVDASPKIKRVVFAGSD